MFRVALEVPKRRSLPFLLCRYFSADSQSISADITKWIHGPASSNKVTNVPITEATSQLTTIKIKRSSECNGLLDIKFNRPNSLNAFSLQLWDDIDRIFEHIERDETVQCVIISGEGRGFSSGMDHQFLMDIFAFLNQEPCDGRKRDLLSKLIEKLQYIGSAPDRCRVPVIAAIHGACVGAGLDFATACDLRYCETSAYFSIKEVDMAMVADVGSLQRLPYIIGESKTKDMAYTGRHVPAKEAENFGLISTCYDNVQDLSAHVYEMAKLICSKSPLVIRGIKETIHYKRDHSTQDSLRQVRAHNAAILINRDLGKVMQLLAKRSKDCQN